MSINSVLKNEGIEVKSALNEKQIQKISLIISKEILASFPELNLKKQELYNCLSSLNMFIADFDTNDSMAKYFSKTNSIYFNSKMDLKSIDTLIIHECIHAIQELRNNNGKVVKLGLFNVLNNSGEGINEAAVQFMSSIVSGAKTDTVKYYNMDFSTLSTLFYPIQTALINELIFFTGSYPLYYSTLFSNDVFKNIIITKTNKKIYNTIVKNFDLLIKYESALQKYSNKITNYYQNSIKYNKLDAKITAYKQLIIETTLSTQNLIIDSCFNNELENVKDLQELENVRERLQNFKEYIIQNDCYNYYENFSKLFIQKCNSKEKYIIEHGSLSYTNSTQLELLDLERTSYNLKFFQRLFRKLKILSEADGIYVKKIF